ncbi:hypothetical protein SEUCBS139899_005878 [Sporothrix eucalyptigena]|uniref:ABM domain-containing protein n=1 Tax=Sporothrix eucalyptigena TaxID=1812306 RepID=A0ABP0AX21_9PEZI
MSRSFVFARLPLHTAEAQQDLLRVVKPVTEFAFTGEPGVTKYAALTAQGDHALYMLEEYVDQAASDSHIATEGVQNFVKWLGTPGHVNGTPRVWFTVPTEYVHLSAPLADVKEPYVVVTEYNFPGGASASLKLFEAPFASAKERGALLYGVYTEKSNANVVLTAEVYSSASGYVGPAAAAQGEVASTAVVEVKYGFLHKRGAKSSL